MTLTKHVYERLRQDIVKGTIPSGQPLRLALLRDHYDAGFSPLREALTRLEAEHLVVSESQRGFKVAPLSLDKLRDNMETRAFIECEALRRSISNGADNWETSIVSSLHALKLQTERIANNQVNEVDNLEKCHFEFHKSLISACGSIWLMSFFSTLYAVSERYRLPALQDSFKSSERSITEEHSDLAKAALERDADRATNLLTEHYAKTTRFLEKVHYGVK